jgi:hypothetical protein
MKKNFSTPRESSVEKRRPFVNSSPRTAAQPLDHRHAHRKPLKSR